MECHEVVKTIGWLGETWGFWVQTGAFLLSAFGGIYIIHHNGKLAKKRALIDLIIHQKSDAELIAATQAVYKLHDDGTHLSALVGSDSKERTSILRVLNNQEFIATGIRMGAFDEQVYKQMQCSNVRKLWSAASGFVHEMRKIDGRATIFQDFEKLAVEWEKNPIRKL